MFKIKYIGWFFTLLWNCLKDLRYGVDCFNEIGLWKENWQDFRIRIYFDTDPEMLKITKNLEKISDDKNNKTSDI